MSPQVEHPSFLALDGLRWGNGTAELRAHVEACTACAAHLERLARPTDVPAWVRGLEEERPREWRSLFSGGMRWAWGGALAAAMTVLVLMVLPLHPREAPQGPYVGAKGAPAVVVHVRHEKSVAAWDGNRPLSPGDSVRLEVAASGYSQVWVGSPMADEGFTTLYSGALPEGGALLPTSWRVDAEGDSEHLVVVLSRAPLSQEELRRAAIDRSRTPEVWVEELKLPKRSAP